VSEKYLNDGLVNDIAEMQTAIGKSDAREVSTCAKRLAHAQRLERIDSRKSRPNLLCTLRIPQELLVVVITRIMAMLAALYSSGAPRMGICHVTGSWGCFCAGVAYSSPASLLL
jgi:hypothetical protein